MATKPEAQSPAGAEQRLAPRHNCSLAALTQVQLLPERQRLFAWVHDISAGGVAVDVRTPLEPGQEVICRLTGTRPEERFEVSARVIQSKLRDGLYRAGCKFTEPLPAEHLEAVLRKLKGAAQAESPGT